MDKQQIASAAAVMLAASQGAEIQYCSKPYMKPPHWSTIKDAENAVWNWDDYRYRVKPKTIKARMYLAKSDGYHQIYLIHHENDMQRVEQYQTFVRWVSDWVEVEV